MVLIWIMSCCCSQFESGSELLWFVDFDAAVGVNDTYHDNGLASSLVKASRGERDTVAKSAYGLSLSSDHIPILYSISNQSKALVLDRKLLVLNCSL